MRQIVDLDYRVWRKSSYTSETADCVEIAYQATETTVGIRDSKDPAGGRLVLPTTALHHLTAQVILGAG